MFRGTGLEKGADGMARQRHTAEEIINKLREAAIRRFIEGDAKGRSD
jgi:hypothetical protein